MTEAVYSLTTACRSCASNRLREVFSLGDLHLSGFPMPGESDTPKAPLTLMECGDCDLVQLSASVRRDLLYREYHYRSGVNESLKAALHEVVAQAQTMVTLEKGDHVLDIGCNDGTLLDAYDQPRLHLIGVDPSDIATEAVRGGTQRRAIVHDYFPMQAHTFDPVPCKIITSIAMLYDVDDLSGFATEIKKWLHPEGVWVIEFADLRRVLKKNAFDTICHEHVTYWNLQTLEAWLSRHGLKIFQTISNSINGGSMRVFCGHGKMQHPGTWPITPGEWEEFAGNVRDIGIAVRERLYKTRLEGDLVLGIGASTKGNTLLQHWAINSDLLRGIGDRQPHKWGRETVGMRIPIISEEEMRARKPVALLALPWHLGETLRAREPWSTFWFPLPTFSVAPARDSVP